MCVCVFSTFQECKLTPILSLFFVFYRYLTYFNGVEKYSFHLYYVELRCFRFFNFWIVKSTTWWCFRLDKCNRRKFIKIKCNSLIFRVCWYISWFLGLDVSFLSCNWKSHISRYDWISVRNVHIATNKCMSFTPKKNHRYFWCRHMFFQFWNSKPNSFGGQALFNMKSLISL